MANTGKDASGNTIFLRNAFGTGVDNANAYVYSTAVYFSRNGVEQLATLDTVTPANNRPLPVIFCSDGGAAATIKAGNTQAVAGDSAQVFTLRPGGALENAITLATPNTTLLTYTIAINTSISDYVQLVGRAWVIFFPVMTGATARIRVRQTNGTGSGEILYDETGQPHDLFIAASTRTYSAQATAFISGAIGSQIAFETYSDATTTVNQAAARTITIKAVI